MQLENVMLKLSRLVVATVFMAGSTAAAYSKTRVTGHERPRVSHSAAAARAQAASHHAPQSPAVYEWGKYQGQDPDINVRLMLRRDYHN